MLGRLRRSWHCGTNEQMSGRINWPEKVFQAPVQSVLVGDIRQDSAQPHSQWLTFRNRTGWLSCGCGLKLLCCDSQLYKWQSKAVIKRQVCVSRSGPASPRLCLLSGQLALLRNIWSHISDFFIICCFYNGQCFSSTPLKMSSVRNQCHNWWQLLSCWRTVWHTQTKSTE